MPGRAYRFSVGQFQCISLQEAERKFPQDQIPGLFTNVTPEEVQNALETMGIADEEGHSAMNCLLIEADGKKLLVDTGMGLNVNPHVGGMLPALNAEGIHREDIDRVFITHCHPDHVFGLWDDEGQIMFPNASYFMSRMEWEYWMGEEAQAQVAPERLDPILSKLRPLEDQFTLLEDGDEVLPGVVVHMLPGHSRGHAGLDIESDGEKLFFVTDLLHTMVQMGNTHFHHRFDQNAELAQQTRYNALSHAADENLLTMFYHLPFPGIAHVVRAGDGFRWQPISS